jgi:hypothetical protein
VSDDQKPLRDDEREKLARDLTGSELARTPPAKEPLAIFTAGQSGSGKSMIVRSMRVHFEGVGERAVEIDPDNIRPQIPYMRDRIERGDLDIPQAAFSDAGRLGYRMMQLSAEQKRNIIYDGTLANYDNSSRSMGELKNMGYRVEVHGMAVSPDLSHASTYDRREGEIRKSPTGFGRGVSDDFHDQAVKGLVDTIGKLQDNNKVDAIVLYDRDGKVVGSTKLDKDKGEWVPDQRMQDTLREIHSRPDAKTLQDTAQTWDRAAELMRYRGADRDEQRKVDGFRDASLGRLPAEPSIDPATQAKARPDADRPDKGERLVIADGSRVHEKRVDGAWRETDAEPQGNSPKGVFRLDTAREADPKSKDEYRGAVLHVDKANVYQLGSDSQVVRHDRDRFKDTPAIGDNARIGYSSGQAVILARSAEPTPDRAAPTPTIQTPTTPTQAVPTQAVPTRAAPDRER